MKIYLDLLLRPEATLARPDVESRLSGLLGVVTLCAISAVAMVGVLEIGNPPGGSPALWYGLGALLDLGAVRGLSRGELWLLLYPIKLAGDAGLIFLPALIAWRRYGAGRAELWRWAKVYCYLLTAVDVFWLLALAPATLLGAHGRPLLVTNLLTYQVCGLNIVLFTNAYRCCYRLSFDRALFGWFIAAVAIPVAIIGALMLVVP